MDEVCRGLAGEISFEESIRRQTNILEYEIMQDIKEKLEGYINEVPRHSSWRCSMSMEYGRLVILDRRIL